MTFLIHNLIKLKCATNTGEIVADRMIDFKIDDAVRVAIVTIGAYLSHKSVHDNFSIGDPNDTENVRSLISERVKSKPSNGFLPEDLDHLADRFLSLQAPEAQLNCWEQDIRLTHHKAEMLVKHYDLSMSLVAYLAEAQHSYLQSRNWMDKKKLTFLQVAALFPVCSEATIRRKIHHMRLILGKWQFPASDLLCANNLPFICKQVARVLNSEPCAGRPRLYKLLHGEGYRFSDGQIRNALELLRAARKYRGHLT